MLTIRKYNVKGLHDYLKDKVVSGFLGRGCFTLHEEFISQTPELAPLGTLHYVGPVIGGRGPEYDMWRTQDGKILVYIDRYRGTIKAVDENDQSTD